MTARLSYALCRSACRRGDCRLESAVFQYVDYSVDYGRLACSRAACYHRHALAQAVHYGFFLLLAKLYARGRLGSFNERLRLTHYRLQIRVHENPYLPRYILLCHVERRQIDDSLSLDNVDVDIPEERHLLQMGRNQFARLLEEYPRLFAQHILRQIRIAFACKPAQSELNSASDSKSVVGLDSDLGCDGVGLFESYSEDIFSQTVRVLQNSLHRVGAVHRIQLHGL